MRPAISRGDIFLVDLEPIRGAETGKVRPCVIIQNDMGNTHSPITIVACITSTLRDKKGPIDVYVSAKETGLSNDSRIMLNQIRAVDISRLKRKIGRVPDYKIIEIDHALHVSLDLYNCP